MKFKNLLFVLSGPLLGVTVVSGVAAGILFTTRKEQASSVLENDSATLPTISSLDVVARNYLNSLRAGDIVVYEQPMSSNIRVGTTKKETARVNYINKSDTPEKDNYKTLKISDTFSFNVQEEQLDVNKTKEIPHNISIKFEILDSKNTTSRKNQGYLTISLTAYETETNVKLAEKDIDVTSFKLPDRILLNLLNNTQTNFKLESDELKTLTLEDLNQPSVVTQQGTSGNQMVQVSTINRLVREFLTKKVEESKAKTQSASTIQHASFSTSIKTDLHLNNSDETISLKSKDLHALVQTTKQQPTRKLVVKKIAKESGISYFYLGFSDDSSFRFNLFDEGKIKSQILIDEIMVKELAPSSISVIPMGNKTEEAKEINKKLGAKEGEKVENALTVSIEGSSKKTKTFSLSSYVTEEQEDNKVKADLVFTYGSGDTAINLSTAKDEDLKWLNAMNFNFDLLSSQVNVSSDAIAINNVQETIKKVVEEVNKNKKPSRNKRQSQPLAQQTTSSYKTLQLQSRSLKKGSVELDLGISEDKDCYVLLGTYKYIAADKSEQITFTSELSLIKLSKKAK